MATRKTHQVFPDMKKSSSGILIFPFLVGLCVTFGIVGGWKMMHTSVSPTITEKSQFMQKEQQKIATQPEVVTQPQMEADPAPNPPQPEPIPMPAMFQKPYSADDTAVVGSFTEIGKDINKSVYSYKVREKGDNKVLFTRFQAFKKGADATKFTVLDETSTPIADGTQYTANQVLYIEYSEENPEVIKEAPDAASCTAYTTFFTCILATDTTADKKIMQQQYDSFQASLKILTPQQQNSQCTSYLEKVRTKASNDYQKTCLEKIK